jgi:hypothetical protein
MDMPFKSWSPEENGDHLIQASNSYVQKKGWKTVPYEHFKMRVYMVMYINPWNNILLQKLTVNQLVTKVLTFNETFRFNNVIRRVHNLIAL